MERRSGRFAALALLAGAALIGSKATVPTAPIAGRDLDEKKPEKPGPRESRRKGRPSRGQRRGDPRHLIELREAKAKAKREWKGRRRLWAQREGGFGRLVRA